MSSMNSDTKGRVVIVRTVPLSPGPGLSVGYLVRVDDAEEAVALLRKRGIIAGDEQIEANAEASAAACNAMGIPDGAYTVI